MGRIVGVVRAGWSIIAEGTVRFSGESESHHSYIRGDIMSYTLPLRRGPLLGCWALALLLGIGVPRTGAAEDKKDDLPAEESVLRTYETPPGMALAVVRMLQKVYPPSSSVRIIDNGDSAIVVYGPSAVQAAAARFVRAAQPGGKEPPRQGERPGPVRPRDDKTGKKGSTDKPLTITALGNRLILTCDDPDALADAQRLIQLLTKMPEGAGDFEVLSLRNATADDAAKVIDEAFNGKSQQTQQQQPFGGFAGFMNRMRQQAQQTDTKKEPKVRVVADSNSNTLIVWASPLEMVAVRRLVEALDSGKTESVAIVRRQPPIRLKYALASDVEWVVRDLYREQMNENPRATTDTGFGGPFARFRGLGGFQNRNVDAAGNPRRVSVALSVDDRTNTLFIGSPDAIYKEIKDLAEKMDKDAENSRRTVRIEKLDGIDAYQVQLAIEAVMGRTTRTSARPSLSNLGGFGGPQGGFGGPGGLTGFGGPGGPPGGFGGPGGGQRGMGNGGQGRGTGGRGPRQP
jgi:hypothetical protein